MPLMLEGKKAMVSELSEVATKSVSAVAAHYRGITVTDMTQLRINARKAGIYLKVSRNTLAKRAFKGTEFECMNDALTGPIVLAFSKTEPSGPARLFRDFAKQNSKLDIKAIALSGKLYDKTALDKIAQLPTKGEAISLLMSVMKAPITKLVRTLVEPHTKLVRTIDAIRVQKEEA
jgi:large subunit ribosomal protein L10